MGCNCGKNKAGARPSSSIPSSNIINITASSQTPLDGLKTQIDNYIAIWTANNAKQYQLVVFSNSPWSSTQIHTMVEQRKIGVDWATILSNLGL